MLDKDFSFQNIGRCYLTLKTKERFRKFSLISKIFLVLWIVYFKIFQDQYFLSENFLSIFYLPFYLLIIPHLYLIFATRKYTFQLEFCDDCVRVVRTDFTSALYIKKLELPNLKIKVSGDLFELSNSGVKVALPLKFPIYQHEGDKEMKRIDKEELVSVIKENWPHYTN